MNLPIQSIIPKKNENMSDEGYQLACSFKPKPTDIIVSTMPKSGTTVTQWICHHLRSNLFLDFDDMYQVSPWIELSYDIGIDFKNDELVNRFSPRVYKSHLRIASLPKGCKYIVTVRRPIDVAKSFYFFMLEKGVPEVQGKDFSDFILMKTFFKEDMRFGASYWEYLEEYWKCRHHPSLLIIIYEDLVKDMKGHIKKIADFMGVTADENLVNKVVDISTKESMSKYNSKLDESWSVDQIQKLKTVPRPHVWRAASRVSIKSHPNTTLSQEAENFLNERWNTVIKPLTNCHTYDELCHKLRNNID